jgi:hypothetical protein
MMKSIARMLLAVLAASQVAVFAGAYAADKPYVVLGEDLQRLKDDFNAKVGTIRLLFIIGPTCAICLRGMADLNDELLAEYQDDPRLNTFAVHVPVLQAEEKHIAPAMQLMTGSRISHYWDQVGTIGLLYQDVLDTEVYVWDVWFAYGPEAVWGGAAPPAPDYWEHQLPSAFPAEKKLDKKRFAREVLARINALSPDDLDADADAVAANQNPLADRAVIPVVGQGFRHGADRLEQEGPHILHGRHGETRPSPVLETRPDRRRRVQLDLAHQQPQRTDRTRSGL